MKFQKKPLILEPQASGCLHCTSHSKGSHGYTMISVNGTKKLLHRVVYEECNGPLRPGQVVRHSCDNRSCVNPIHLEVGSQLDNVRDTIARGRYSPPPHVPGVKHGMVKLTEAQVREIRKDPRPSRTVAKVFGVSKSQVLRIRRSESWSHL